MTLVPIGASADTVWNGAPGEPLPGGVAIRVKDAEGRPIAGAAVTWEAVSRNAQVLSGSTVSDARGLATAVWQLGTSAGESQQLRVAVRSRQSEGEVLIRARAVPHVVAQLKVSVDTPAVLRVGDSLPISVTAVDPYGNIFSVAPPVLAVSDTTLGKVAGTALIGGPKRGAVTLSVSSEYVTTRVAVKVVQYVAAIAPDRDTINFTSLGAERPVTYVVRDDRNRVVADTAATLSLGDTGVARLASGAVRSVQPGATQLQLAVGSVTKTVAVAVQQRVASLQLARDTIRFSALRDTTTIAPIARDSLGYPVLHPDLVVEVANGQVAKVSDQSLQSVAQGVTVLTLRDPVSGLALSTPVVVDQVIDSIGVSPLAFDALGDSMPIVVTAWDRLGSAVVGSAYVYTTSDSSIAKLDAVGWMHSMADGRVSLRVTDPRTGKVGAADVVVAQKVAALALNTHAVSFDALGDSTILSLDARDRLGHAAPTTTVAFRSSASVAAVSPGGVVHSRDNGTALVIAASSDGPADTLHVTIAQVVTKLVPDKDSLLFESLRAVQGVRPTALDRLGAPVVNARLTFTSDDPSVATVDSLGHITAVSNGATALTVTNASISARVNLRVAQRPVRVVMPADTVRFVAFGDSVHVSAVAVDSLGSPVSSGTTSVIIGDPSVATVDSLTLTARGNGLTAANVGVAGITGRLVVEVTQVATSVQIHSTFPNPVLTLTTGAAIPLDCAAFDRNGFGISRAPALIGSVKATVSGTSCADARVARSGYDTLIFGLDAIRVRLPVIIATAPDSVGVIVAAESLPSDSRIQYVGEDLANPSILALRPLVQQILAAYGNPSTSLGRARALRDWIARTAVHPHAPLHPDGSTANLSVLPPGKTWADVNALYWRTYLDSMFDANNQYWWGVGYDGYAMLDRLLGTLDPTTGLRADDGMMVHIDGVRYQIRDLQTYRYPICSFQDIMLTALWEAAGLQGMLTTTIGHDPAAVFIPELDEWVYEDPTYNEEYLLDGVGNPLSSLDLLAHTTAGELGRLHVSKLAGPSYDPEVYVSGATYMNEHPAGFVIMGSQLNNRVVGVGGWPSRNVQIDGPGIEAAPQPLSNPNAYPRVSADTAFPSLGVVVDQVALDDSVFVVHLSSTFPSYTRFERQVEGQGWEVVGAVDVLPVGACKVEYRSVDVMGLASATAVLDVWVPRGQGFVQAAPVGSVRSQATTCS